MSVMGELLREQIRAGGRWRALRSFVMGAIVGGLAAWLWLDG